MIESEAGSGRERSSRSERSAPGSRVRPVDGADAVRFAGLTRTDLRPRLLHPPAARPTVAVGAEALGQPIGLALAELFPSRYAEVLSLYVAPPWRADGLGTELLSRLERELVARGAALADLLYTTGTATTTALESALRRLGWPEPERRMLVCRFRPERILEAPWLAPQVFPAAFEVFPWADLRASERLALADRGWYPRDLDPLAEETTLEPCTSLGLRYRGELAGWLITHRVDADTVRYTTGFVRGDLQRTARLIPLGRLAMQRQVAAGIPFGTWAVSFGRLRMVRLVRGRLAPYLERVVETRRARKVFDPSAIRPHEPEPGTTPDAVGAARGNPERNGRSGEP